MQKLIRGILDFRRNVLPQRRDIFARLAVGQAPDVLFVTCSDSRVAPNWFASTDPGDLFVVRNVGNLVPPTQPDQTLHDHSVASAIEFALSSLGVQHIVICGHSGCGAMHAVCHGLEKVQAPTLRRWLSFAQAPLASGTPLKTPATMSAEDRLSQANVLRQLEHLRTYPIVQERVSQGTLRLHGWWFNIGLGSVYAYDALANEFRLIDETLVQRERLQVEPPAAQI